MTWHKLSLSFLDFTATIILELFTTHLCVALRRLKSNVLYRHPDVTEATRHGHSLPSRHYLSTLIYSSFVVQECVMNVAVSQQLHAWNVYLEHCNNGYIARDAACKELHAAQGETHVIFFSCITFYSELLQTRRIKLA